MLEPLDRTSRRIVGVLVEKELTTPQQYPLSVNALLSGCNQRSNRDPVLHLQEFEVQGALKSLLVGGWTTEIRGAGSRVVKWKHRAGDKLAATPGELAIMAELLLRGSQQPGELRSRANRMHRFSSVQGVEETLRVLAERGLVRQLARRVGERVARWDHVLYPGSEATHDETGFAAASTSVQAVVGPSGEQQSLPTPPSARPAVEETGTLDDRVAELERQLEELRRRVIRLEGGGEIVEPA